VLGPWLERNPNVEFVAAGDPLVHEHLGVPRGQRVSVAGTEFWHGDLADITACFDIGIVPLARNLMNECKSHLKGLEYAACGIPVIASPSESYRWWVEPGVNGFLADKPKQWTDALNTLVNDDGLRRWMGRCARKSAAHATIANHWRDWEAVYARVCGVDAQLAGAGTAA
jgi:glycosyltransferase involved in cell wall biosynthesis